MARRLLGLSTGWLVVVIVGAIALAIGLLALAASIEPGFFSYLCSGLSSGLFSTSLALLISEVVLKPLLVRDMLSMTKLRDRIAEISMRDIGPMDRIPWTSLYASSKKIDVVVDAPDIWVDRDLQRVISRTEGKSLVRIFLPPLGGDLDTQITAAESKLREAWTRRNTKHPKAELEIWFLRNTPLSFMARFDESVVVAIDAGMHSEAKPTMYLQIDIDGTSDVQSWIRDRWQWADEDDLDAESAWSSPKMPPSAIEVRERLGTKLENPEGE